MRKIGTTDQKEIVWLLKELEAWFAEQQKQNPAGVEPFTFVAKIRRVLRALECEG